MTGRTISVDVVEEMGTAYTEYAMAVIIGRAIPNLMTASSPFKGGS